MAEEVSEKDESLNSMIDKLAEVCNMKVSDGHYNFTIRIIWNDVSNLPF